VFPVWLLRSFVLAACAVPCGPLSAALCVGRFCDSLWSVFRSCFLRHTYSVCRSPPLLRCSRTVTDRGRELNRCKLAGLRQGRYRRGSGLTPPPVSFVSSDPLRHLVYTRYWSVYGLLCKNQYYHFHTHPLFRHPPSPPHCPHYCSIQCFPPTPRYCNIYHT